MAKSLTETAKSILMKEGMIPSVSSTQSNPDRDTTAMNPNLSTLRPGSRGMEGRFANPGSNPPGGVEAAQDLGGQTPTSGMPSANFGAVASGKVSKDSSRSGQASVPAETRKQQAEVMEEDVEISEELEAFIMELAEQGLSEEEIAEAVNEHFEIVSEKKEEEEDEDEDEDEDEEEESGRKHMKEARRHKEEEEEDEDEEESGSKKVMKEHVDALLAGENLSEEFRAKAETIFESAVNVRVQEEVQTLEEAYAAALEEEVAKIHQELSEQVDTYLNYVVEEWVKENEVAIETGLRTELTEDFISGLRNLFAEHYIDIPEDKVTVVESLGSRVEELEQKLNEQIDKNVNLSKEINEAKQVEVLMSACDGLTTTQASKLRALAENIEFTSVTEYTQKIETLKESYFPANKVSNANVLDTNVTDDKGMIAEETRGPMAAYVKAIGKSLPK
jgi:hypothetical protein